MARQFHIVVATTPTGGIGKGGTIPWDIPKDRKFFSELTTKTKDPAKINAVIMGRTTYESIPQKHRPLKGRLNVVLSKDPDLKLEDGVLVAPSFPVALELLQGREDVEEIYIGGGEKIYKEAINSPNCATVYVTHVLADIECDRHFQLPNKNFVTVEESPVEKTQAGLRFRFATVKPNKIIPFGGQD